MYIYFDFWDFIVIQKKMHQTKHNSLPFLKNKKWWEKELQNCSLKKGVIVIVRCICKNLWLSYFKGNITRQTSALGSA